MSQFVELLKAHPVDLLTKEALESKEPLQTVKSYFDHVIRLSKNTESSKNVIDEIVVDGLDANQVWWQSKIVLDNIEGDLLERISKLKVELQDRASEEESEESEEESDLVGAENLDLKEKEEEEEEEDLSLIHI